MISLFSENSMELFNICSPPRSSLFPYFLLRVQAIFPVTEVRKTKKKREEFRSSMDSLLLSVFRVSLHHITYCSLLGNGSIQNIT